MTYADFVAMRDEAQHLQMAVHTLTDALKDAMDEKTLMINARRVAGRADRFAKILKTIEGGAS